MSRLPQRDLFGPGRPPIRSEYSRERSYARRRIVTVLVVLLALGGGGYALWDNLPEDPLGIPVIEGVDTFKEKPEDPGGLDVPHQDVHVYEKLEEKGAFAPRIEHLLPPPEAPKPSAEVAPPPPEEPTPPALSLTPIPAPAPATVVDNIEPPQPVEAPSEAPEPPAPPPAAPKVEAPPPVEPVKPAVKKKPAPKVASPKPKPKPSEEPLSIEKVLERIGTKPEATPAQNTSAGDKTMLVQLASVPDENGANALMAKLKKKHASLLGNVELHLTRADLGSRGIYYRIQSEPLAKEEANRLCSSLKQSKAGCLLVRKR